MKPSLVAAFAACGLALAGQAAGAAEAPVSTPAAAVAPAPPTLIAESADVDRPRAGEPAIQRTVIEDRLARIEELRVRGQVQKITVDNKGRAPDYEIITSDGSRDLVEGASGLRSAAGRRVWNVLRF